MDNISIDIEGGVGADNMPPEIAAAVAKALELAAAFIAKKNPGHSPQTVTVNSASLVMGCIEMLRPFKPGDFCEVAPQAACQFLATSMTNNLCCEEHLIERLGQTCNAIAGITFDLAAARAKAATSDGIGPCKGSA